LLELGVIVRGFLLLEAHTRERVQNVAPLLCREYRI
jgi:hypothetical protein